MRDLDVDDEPLESVGVLIHTSANRGLVLREKQKHRACAIRKDARPDQQLIVEKTLQP
nr:hypothetical protein [Cryobacterium sp. TMS1-20-1]